MPVISSCVPYWVQVGVPPWLSMPQLPPEGATMECIDALPAQQAQTMEPSHAEAADHPSHPDHPEHESWLAHAGHSLGGLVSRHERHK
jgi:hypothetical protein